MFKVIVVEGVTFQPKHEIYVDNFPWARNWNGGHQGSFSFKVSELDLEPETRRTNLWPIENWLVVEWNGTPIYAAIITNHKYNRASRTVTISYADIWWFWTRRFVLSDRTNELATFYIDWKKVSYRTVAIRAVKRGIEGDGPLWWELPIAFPAEGPAGTLDRKVWGYSLEKVMDLLTEAMEAGDLNIDFRPRWNTAGGNLEFVMEINGTGPLLEYDLDAEDSPVLDLDYEIDANQLANNVYGTGEGSEVDMVVRTSANPESSMYVALEAVYSGKRVDDKERLQSLVTAQRKNFNQTRRQAGLKVRADGPPNISDFKLGSTIRWRTIDDPYLEPLWNEQTLIGFSGSLKPDVTLVLSEFWVGM